MKQTAATTFALVLLAACSSPPNQGDSDPGPKAAAPKTETQKSQVVGSAAAESPGPEVAETEVEPEPPKAEEPPPPPPPPPIIDPPADQVMNKITLKGVEKAKWWKFGGTYFRLWGTAFTGSQPKGVSVTSDGKKIFVTNTGFHNHNNVTLFEPTELKRITEANFKGNAIESLISPDDSVLWVSNFYHSEVLELDTEDLSVKRRFDVENMPKHMDITPDHKELWIANWASDSVSVVDIASGKAVATIEVGDQPRGTGVLNSGKKVYVTNFGDRSVNVFDRAERKVIKTIDAGCRAPRHIDVAADDRVFVSCYGGHEVFVIDSEKDEIIKRLDVGNGPKTIVISNDQKFAYTADYRGATMSLIDLETWETLVVPLPTFKTSGLTIGSDDRRIYLTGWTARNLMVVERLMPGDQPQKEHGPMRAGKVCRQKPKSDCYKYP
jgi:YVTN family beta-propeller protein